MMSAKYRNYILGLLAVVYALNCMDYTAFGLALQSIKLSLHLSDTELGLATGIASTAFYSAFAVAIGRWADRGNRRVIISLTRAFWVGFVLLTGRAVSFLQLLIARMGVTVGEAGCTGPSSSLLADYFGREELPKAMGIFYLGTSLNAFLGYFVGGWLTQLYGWREMFRLVGLSGAALTFVVWFTLRDPREDAALTGSKIGAVAGDGSPATASDAPPLIAVLRSLLRNVTYRNLWTVQVLSYFFVGGLTQWQPAFFMRSYGLQSGALGTWLAVIYGVPGFFGNVLGGLIASRWGGRNERLQLVAVTVLLCVNSVVVPLVYLAPNYYLAFALLALSTVSFTLTNGPVCSALLSVVPARTRALSTVLVSSFANLIGIGLAPLVAGTLSDALTPVFGVESLRYALCLISPWFIWCGWHSWRASRSVQRDIIAAEGRREAETKVNAASPSEIVHES